MNRDQLKQLERQLSAAADNLRANSDLKSSEDVHIGLEDQSKALGNLPCQDIVRKPDRSASQNQSKTDNESHDKKSQNPDGNQDSDSESQHLSSTDNDKCQWRQLPRLTTGLRSMRRIVFTTSQK